MKLLGVVAAFLVGIGSLVAVVWGLSSLGLVHYQFFAPRYQAVERQVFEETPSYVLGKEQTLAELRLEYNRATSPGQKENIKAMIVNEAATVDLGLLKDRNLRRFVEELRSQ